MATSRRKKLDAFFRQSVSTRSYRDLAHLPIDLIDPGLRERGSWLDGARGCFATGIGLCENKYRCLVVYLSIPLHDSFRETKRPTATWAWICRHMHAHSAPEIGLVSKHQRSTLEVITAGVSLGVFVFGEIGVPGYLTEYCTPTKRRFIRNIWFLCSYSSRVASRGPIPRMNS